MRESRVEFTHDLSIRLLQVTGSDSHVVNAARTSISGEGVTAVSSDKQLIGYLLRHKHTGPFEFCAMQFEITCPIAIARQFMRHRTGSYNEVSARYCKLPNIAYIPEHFYSQGKQNKQSSGEKLSDSVNDDMGLKYEQAINSAFEVYEDLLNAGVSREQARFVLPMCTMTRFWVSMNLHNLLHFITLRSAPGAQEEIRLIANAMLEEVRSHFPLVYQAYMMYVSGSVTFSAKEVEYMRAYNYDCEAPSMSANEVQEVLTKARLLGVIDE